MKWKTTAFAVAMLCLSLYAIAPAQTPPDMDNDGISDIMERDIGTNPNRATLFVRPWQVDKITSILKPFADRVPWVEDFKRLLLLNFRDPATGQLLNLRQYFDRHGIEIAVIGDPDLKYCKDPANPKTCLGRTEFDPSGTGIPCNILEIYWMTKANYACPSSSKSGHTYMVSGPGYMGAWSWDTKGYTSGGTSSNILRRTAYHTPVQLCEPALRNYFQEGAYRAIANNQSSACGRTCTTACCTAAGMANTNDADPPGDGRVEFNTLAFDGTGVIICRQAECAEEKKAVSGTFSMDEVRIHTLVHEIGHALLTNSVATDHCSNTWCPMSGSVTDGRGWNLYPFGYCPTNQSCGCTHATGNAYYVGSPGVVWNALH